MATRGKAARSPAECDELLSEFLAAGDLDAILDLYEPGATFITQDRAAKVGRDAIREAFTPLAVAKPRLTSNIVLTARNGDNLAMLYNDWSMSIRAPDGKTVETTGKAIEVVCRQSDGSWKFAVDDPFGR